MYISVFGLMHFYPSLKVWPSHKTDNEFMPKEFNEPLSQRGESFEHTCTIIHAKWKVISEDTY